ncbi:unnamed protein product, partial [Timema podura]|nr:unnamed protein product [Timema podura]
MEEVKFSKRFLYSDAYKKAVSVGRPVFTEFGTRSYPDPCKNIFSRMVSSLVPELTDNDAINLFTIEDSLYVATETNYLRRVDVKTLDTCEKVDLNKLVGINLSSSHTCRDDKGVYYTLGTSILSGGKYHIITIPFSPSGKAKDVIPKTSILTNIPSSWYSNVSYYHSFGMSENYIVFIVAATCYQWLEAPHRKCEREITERMHGLALRRAEKSTGNIIPVKYKSVKSFFLFHHINTYEENNQLIVDVIAYDGPGIIDALYLKKLRSSEMDLTDPARGRRFVLPLPQQSG